MRFRPWGPRVFASTEGVRWSYALVAWLLWIVIHVWYLIGFRNRVSVMLNWFWNYLTYRQGARIITREPNAQALRIPAAPSLPAATVKRRLDQAAASDGASSHP